MKEDVIRQRLTENGLKVTPQRVTIFQAIGKLHNHPTAEQVIAYIKKNHPNISVGTVYNVLEALVEKQLISKVKTEDGVMRYDAFMNKHHHLYCAETNRIEDFEDAELDELIANHFRKKGIKDFSIEDIQLQITGHFTH